MPALLLIFDKIHQELFLFSERYDAAGKLFRLP